MAQVGPQQAPQLHDYEPGIAPNGLFWTVPISPRSVRVDARRGTASFRLRDHAIPDFHNFENSLLSGPSVPAHVTFDIEWHGPTKPFRVDKPDQQFRGDFRQGRVTAEWSSRQDGFAFQSAPASRTTSVFAAVGHERNGIFYR